jgi:hypothetical protein
MFLDDATPDQNWILQFPIWVVPEGNWNFSPMLDEKNNIITSMKEIQKHTNVILWTVEPDELHLILEWLNSDTQLADRVNKLLKNIYDKNSSKVN